MMGGRVKDRPLHAGVLLACARFIAFLAGWAAGVTIRRSFPRRALVIGGLLACGWMIGGTHPAAASDGPPSPVPSVAGDALNITGDLTGAVRGERRSPSARPDHLAAVEPAARPPVGRPARRPDERRRPAAA